MLILIILHTSKEDTVLFFINHVFFSTKLVLDKICNVWLYIWILFIQIWVLVLIHFIFYDLSLSQLWFEQPTSCLRVYALAHCAILGVFGIVYFQNILMYFYHWYWLLLLGHNSSYLRVVNNPSPTRKCCGRYKLKDLIIHIASKIFCKTFPETNWDLFQLSLLFFTIYYR